MCKSNCEWCNDSGFISVWMMGCDMCGLGRSQWDKASPEFVDGYLTLKREKLPLAEHEAKLREYLNDFLRVDCSLSKKVAILVEATDVFDPTFDGPNRNLYWPMRRYGRDISRNEIADAAHVPVDAITEAEGTWSMSVDVPCELV